MKTSALVAGDGNRRGQKRWRTGWPVGLLAFCAFASGCQSAPPTAAHSHRHADNVFVYPPKLSLDLRRVAVLPLAAESTGGDLPDGCAALTPVLREQLVKTKRFEVVSVDAATVKSHTGQANWTGAESLPPDFLEFLRREYGCDAVLFSEVTAYRAYAPLAVGWRLKLTDARSGQIMWAADEIFDAKQPAVAHAAERFEQPGFAWPLVGRENWVADNSPRQFGRFAAATLLDTLPDR